MEIIHAPDLNRNFFRFKEAGESSSVKEIIAAVRQYGDRAVFEYTAQFDSVQMSEILLDKNTVSAAYDDIDSETVQALKKAAFNIQAFSELQKEQLQDFETELTPGVTTGQRVIPLQRIGVYVPGGRFPLASTLLMCAVPARVAGVGEIAVCSPPTYRGNIHPAILVAADIAKVDEVYQMGGVQAVAALAYGTESVKRVDKIVGPGNKYVAQAKKEVFGVVGIDFIAGPTEVLILADDTANPEFLAADLLAQAEHDSDAVPILVTSSESLAQKVDQAIQRQLPALKNREIAKSSLHNNGLIILVQSLTEAVSLINRKAPEHLQLQIRNPGRIIPELRNYGSLFIGELAGEVLGDYSSGINHTLPTNGSARYTSGLSVRDFLKLATTLQVSREGFESIAPVAEILAETEGLHGHGKSIKIRRERLEE
ncbi:MAG: histidinol dehydrogenase [bacterium]